MTRPLHEIEEELSDGRAKLRSVNEELEPLLAKIKSGSVTDGEKERAANLAKHGEKLTDKYRTLRSEFNTAVIAHSRKVPGEVGDGATDDYLTLPNQNRLHAWTKTAIVARDGKTLRERGTHSIHVPVIGPFLNAWPTDPLTDTDADKMPHPTPRRLRFVTDLLSVREVTEDGVSYIRQTARTNNAAAVARHAQKPTSVYELTQIVDRTRTIAHISEPVAIQDLDDNENLDLFIESELVHGLRLGLENEVVNGDGTGESMEGLLTVITATEAFNTDLLETTRNAVTTLEEAEVEPNAWLMSPANWATIEKTKATTGEFIIGDNNPVDLPQRRLHSIPVVTSNAMGTNILLGDFSGARLAVRQNAQIDWATSGAVFDDPEYHDLFDHNQTKARSELRGVLEVTSIPKFLKVATS